MICHHVPPLRDQHEPGRESVELDGRRFKCVTDELANNREVKS